MIKKVHEHIITELQQNARTDTIFVQTAIVLNFVTLAINSLMATESRTNTSLLVVMFIFVSLTIVVNLIVIQGMLKGKQTRNMLLSGLMKMYKDQDVEGYYDPSLLGNYNTRYNLFILAVVFLGLIAIVVPFVIR
ncbi:MAG: hypothetical protein E3J56_02125 [Candidatus Aminicenantes bacterium]|nr:MAG: hypothetical protein E3J56_02125 [Candidatus Aminicenantes bacterium]